jgi:alkanesulfonate monooxygenase SsuD/methylene tetrahydromethanopterin reductase-like flavin-dependent oxidoreductase (luciferase family)
MFFSGDLSGEGAHDDMAKTIARDGKEWVHAFWRPQDVTAYMFRLWLEYARIMSDDREEMNFILS